MGRRIWGANTGGEFSLFLFNFWIRNLVYWVCGCEEGLGVERGVFADTGDSRWCNKL